MVDTQVAPWDRVDAAREIFDAEVVDILDEPTMPGAQFNPADIQKYLTQLSGKPYLEVMWRLFWLEQSVTRYEITSKTEFINPDAAAFTVTVSIWDEKDVRDPAAKPIRTGTGVGSETKSDFRDFIEKAQTKALGRALAQVGFGTQFATELGGELDAPSNPRPVDAPVGGNGGGYQFNQQNVGPAMQARPQQGGWQGGRTQNNNGNGGWTGGPTTSTEPASDKQRKFMWARATEVYGDSAQDVINGAAEQMGTNVGSLTKAQASQIIEGIQNKTLSPF